MNDRSHVAQTVDPEQSMGIQVVHVGKRSTCGEETWNNGRPDGAQRRLPRSPSDGQHRIGGWSPHPHMSAARQIPATIRKSQQPHERSCGAEPPDSIPCGAMRSPGPTVSEEVLPARVTVDVAYMVVVVMGGQVQSYQAVLVGGFIFAKQASCLG